MKFYFSGTMVYLSQNSHGFLIFINNRLQQLQVIINVITSLLFFENAKIKFCIGISELKTKRKYFKFFRIQNWQMPNESGHKYQKDAKSATSGS